MIIGPCALGNQPGELYQANAEHYTCLSPFVCRETKMIMGCHRSAWLCAGCPPASNFFFFAGLTVFEHWRLSKLLSQGVSVPIL